MEYDVIFHDEVQLMDFGETRASGPYIKLKLRDPEQLAIFRGMDTATAKKTGHILNMTLCNGDIAVEEERKEDYGKLAQKLMASGVFYRFEVAKAVGTDEEYREWIRHKKCVVCGKLDYADGEMKNEAAHVRRAGQSGVGYKAEFSCVPLCNHHHREQHQHGEGEWREMFDKKCAQFRGEWVAMRLKAVLGYESWKDVPPVKVKKFFEDNYLDMKYLPMEYKKCN